MSDKNKTKVPKSDKTRLSDLAPQKQARGGVVAPTPPLHTKKVRARGITVPPF